MSVNLIILCGTIISECIGVTWAGGGQLEWRWGKRVYKQHYGLVQTNRPSLSKSTQFLTPMVDFAPPPPTPTLLAKLRLLVNYRACK